MTEAGHLTINPYIESGGILGNRLEVNPQVADRILTAVRLDHKVYVTRGDREQVSYNAQGTDTLILSKAASSNQLGHQDSRDLSSLRILPAGWEVSVFDQEIHKTADSNLSKTFKAKSGVSNTEAYAKEFTKIISKEVSHNIGIAWGAEKNTALKEEIQFTSRVGTAFILGTALTGGSSYLAVETIENFANSDQGALEGIIAVAGALASTLGITMGLVVLEALKKAAFQDNVIDYLAQLVPNPKLKNRIEGSVALKINQNKLIRLKDAEL